MMNSRFVNLFYLSILFIISADSLSQTWLNGLQACYPLNCSGENNAITGPSLNGLTNLGGNVTCAPNHLSALNSAAQFGGLAADFIELPNDPAIKPTTALTIGGWFFVTTGSQQVLIYSGNGCGSIYGAYTLLWDGVNKFVGYKMPGPLSCGNGANISSNPVSPGWHHLIWYLDNFSLRMVVDNITILPVSHSIPFNYDNTKVILGGTNIPTSNAPFNGRMDNLKFWNRLLTADEINDLFVNDPAVCGGFCTAPPTPIASWEFNGNLNDGVGLNNGTSFNFNGITAVPVNPNFVPDRCGNPASAIRLSGNSLATVGDFIQMQASGPLGNSPRSVSFWMRTTATNNSVPKAMICYGSALSCGANAFEIDYDYGGSGLGPDICSQHYTYCHNCLNDGFWHHIVASYPGGTASGINNINIYVDGILTTGVCAGFGTSVLNTINNIGIRIGCNVENPPKRFFTGDLDEFYIYNRALTQQEVDQLYTCKCNPLRILGPSIVCQGNTYTYSAPQGLSSYMWIVPNGWTIINGAGSPVIQVIAGSNSGNLQVTVNNCNPQVLSLPVYNNCSLPCPQSSSISTIGYSPLTAPSIISGPIIIDHDITIGGSGLFIMQNGDFIIQSGVKITVMSGVTLLLSDAHLYSCSNYMWSGIKVMNGANIGSVPGPNGLSTLIEDAEIAIQLDNIGAGHATPLLSLNGVVFNKNIVGIEFKNSTLTTPIPVLIKSCVFTKRILPSGPMTWPGSDITFPGLRYAPSGATSTLFPPYLQNPNYPTGLPNNILKMSLAGFTNSGIRIINIGNPLGGSPSPGIDLTSWSNPTSVEFNLFDNLYVGIDIRNASMTTINNVFQECGVGINDTMVGLMNGRLSLSPKGTANPNTPNRFWNCYWGIRGMKVYDFDIEKATFWNSPYFRGWGIQMSSNRFSYRMRYNSFCNVATGSVDLDFFPSLFNVISAGTGIYADSLIISQNYFGADITYMASLPYPPGLAMSRAIHLVGDNVSAWSPINPPKGFIQSNIADRVAVGIELGGMKNYPIEISNNKIRRENIGSLSGSPWSGFGIGLTGTQGNKIVRYNNVNSNVLGANGANACYYFDSNITPDIKCNIAEDNDIGFYFWGNNTGVWQGNIMSRLNTGLLLQGNNALGAPNAMAIIGQQGSSTMGSGNQWINWNSGSFHTSVSNPSDASNSKLYINSGAFNPTNNTSTNAWLSYNNPGNIIMSSGPPYNCPFTAFPSLPAIQKMQSQDVVLEESLESKRSTDMEIFPNPSRESFSITNTNINESIIIRIFDVVGNVVYLKTVGANVPRTFDIYALKASLYFIEIENEAHQIVRKKLVKE